jgi:ABC-2 type transport system permease protein
VTALRLPWAFLVRDFRIEASYKGAFVRRLAVPVLAVVIFYFVARAIRDVEGTSLGAYGGSYFAFTVLGLALLSYMTAGVTWLTTNLRASQLSGALEHVVLSGAPLSGILVSSSLAGFAIGAVSMVGFLAVAVAFGLSLGVANVGFALLSFLLATVSFMGLALLSASLVFVTRRGAPLAWAVRSSSLVLAGVFYPVSVLPEALRLLSQALPLTHALELIRGSLLLGHGAGDLWPHLLALVVISVVLTAISLAACRLAVNVARAEGGLSHA